MASHQPGVVCESDQPGPGPWAQIKDSNDQMLMEIRKKEKQNNNTNKTALRKLGTETTTSVIRQKKGSASPKTNVLKNESRIEQMGLFLAQGGRRESLLCECSLHIP